MPALGNAVCWPVLGAALDRFRSIDGVDKSALQTGFAADFPIPELAYRSLKRMTHNALCDAKTAGRINEQRAVADRLAGLGKPVLVLWGDRDVLTPTQANVDRYRAAGLDPVVIAGSGHSPMVEKPAEFVSAVQGFIQAH
ncbi:alpha/beta fold hydrolase [Mycolicibacter terrae]|uniref:alpha/beta fold hydrolase n=1 Tax=Mycolicibacter terrae TaxID=1788 RepID=UPI001F24A784|nr:alpha/beta hydrolase [Mycolicibacter terrae]